MNFLKKNDGFTLIELLASITILSIFLFAIGNFLTNNYKYSSSFDSKLSSVYIAQGILSNYQSKDFDSELHPKLGRTEPVDFNEIFKDLEDRSQLESYEAFVTISNYSLNDVNASESIMIKIKVEVISKNNNINKSTTLEGSVRK